MEDIRLGNPWIFTLVVVIVWALLSISIEVIFFDDNVTEAAVTGMATGLVFAFFYITLRRKIET